MRSESASDERSAALCDSAKIEPASLEASRLSASSARERSGGTAVSPAASAAVCEPS